MAGLDDVYGDGSRLTRFGMVVGYGGVVPS